MKQNDANDRRGAPLTEDLVIWVNVAIMVGVVLIVALVGFSPIIAPSVLL